MKRMKLEARTANKRLAQRRVSWLIEHPTSHQLLFCIGSAVLRTVTDISYLIDSLSASGNINKNGRHLSQYKA